MPSEPSPSQNINISGSQLSNVQVGGQAGRDLAATQSQQIASDASKPLTPADIEALLDQFEGLLQASALPAADREKAIRSLKTAKDEVTADEPDKEFAAKSLQRATKVLKDAGETVDASTGLWQKVKPILEAVSPWLGVATSFLI